MGTHFNIRASKPEDIGEMTALWREVFGDGEQFVSGFYETVRPKCALAFDGAVLAAMVNIAVVSRDGKKGGYVYAACVKESYRGRGLFGAVMRFCEYLDDYSFLCLIPATDALVSMYGHLGYTAGRLLPDRICPTEPESFQATSDVLFSEYTASLASGEILPSRELFGFAVGDFLENGGKVGKIGSSTVIYRSESRKNGENIIKVYEMFSPTSGEDAIIGLTGDTAQSGARRAMFKEIPDGKNPAGRFVMRGLWLDI